MTEQDLRNRDLVFKFVSENMGYSDESLAYFKKELYDPFIDDEFKKILGPDLRARFKFSPTFDLKDDGEDHAWSMFTEFFHSFTCQGCKKQPVLISKGDFYKNTILYNKNEVKIKKVMVDLYLKKPTLFTEDVSRCERKEFIRGKDINEKTIEEYIVKSFEEIGKFKKTGKSEYELVISLNFVDWFLCSAKESWSSCFDIERGYYWFGVPGLIGDKNRAFAYVTDGSKKETNGIRVDRFNARSWILLTKTNKKSLVRFYPSANIMDIKDVIQVTGDNSFISSNDIHEDGKHPLELLFFKKGVASTVSNDACKIEIEKNTPIVKIGYSGGIQYFRKDLSRPEGTNFSNGEGIFRFNPGKTYNDAGITVPYCDCGEPLYKRVDGRNYCKKCYEAGFYTCECCGRTMNRKSNPFVEMDFKDGKGIKKACPSCKALYVTCKHCGKLLKKDTVKTVNGDEYVCGNCYTQFDYKKCRTCGKYMPSSYLIYVHDRATNKRKKRCEPCIGKTFAEYVKCTQCGEYWDKGRINDDGRCNKCHGTETGEAAGVENDKE